MEFKDLKVLDDAGYEVYGVGNTATVYQHPSKPEEVIKAFNKEVPFESALNEYNQSINVLNLGVKAPKVYGLVNFKGVPAIIYQKLLNKVSLSKAISKEPERLEELTKLFARETKKLHSLECDKSHFFDYKSRIVEDTKKCRYFTPEQRNKILEFLRAIPEVSTVLHGDLHTGNFVLSNEQPYFIDFGSIAYGHPYFDLGSFYLIFDTFADKPMVQESFHLNAEQMRKIFRVFVGEYFNDPSDEFYAKKSLELSKYKIFFFILAQTELGIDQPEDFPFVESLINLY